MGMNKNDAETNRKQIPGTKRSENKWKQTENERKRKANKQTEQPRQDFPTLC